MISINSNLLRKKMKKTYSGRNQATGYESGKNTARNCLPTVLVILSAFQTLLSSLHLVLFK